MSRSGRATLMLLTAIIMARLLWSGGFGWFVQQHMQYPLIAATAVLFGLGGYEVVGAVREARSNPERQHRSVAPAIGWLMTLPLGVLIAVAPTGLGASAADRVEPYTPTEVETGFPPLPTSSGPIESRVFDFIERAVWDEEGSLEGVPIRLEGLVVNDPEVDDGFLLTRFMVSCCAADGIPLQVLVRHDGPPIANDTWVIADVVWRPPEVPYAELAPPWVVEADALSVEIVGEPPSDSYESPY